MRVLLQRVSRAAVHIEGETVGSIGRGHLLLVGFHDEDGEEALEWMASKGRRPSFVGAAHPDRAVPLYERFVSLLRDRAPGAVETGEFGAMMEVELVNDGPVTLMLER